MLIKLSKKVQKIYEIVGKYVKHRHLLVSPFCSPPREGSANQSVQQQPLNDTTLASKVHINEDI